MKKLISNDVDEQVIIKEREGGLMSYRAIHYKTLISMRKIRETCQKYGLNKKSKRITINRK